MSDIVNDYFKRFYPDDWESAEYRFTTMLGGMCEYPDRSVNSIFPQMECADGFTFSVQGHWGAYSSPRDDFAEHYSSVEVGFPSERVEDLMPYIDGADSNPTQTVYGYVPLHIVEKIIADHGGLKAAKEGAA